MREVGGWCAEWESNPQIPGSKPDEFAVPLSAHDLPTKSGAVGGTRTRMSCLEGSDPQPLDDNCERCLVREKPLPPHGAPVERCAPSDSARVDEEGKVWSGRTGFAPAFPLGRGASCVRRLPREKMVVSRRVELLLVG